MTATVWTLGAWSGTGGGAPTPDAYGSMWYVEKSSGWYESPAMRTNITDREQSDGAFDGPAWLPGRTIGLDGWIVGASDAGLLQSIRAGRALLVAGARTGALTCADADLTLQSTVRRDGEALFTRSGLTAQFSFLFYAPDPALYSTTLNHVSTGLYSGAIGRAYSKAYPRVYGPLGSQGIATMHNSGTLNAYPVLTVSNPSMPLVNPRVQLVGGSQLSLNLTMNVGETLVVDLGQQTILLNNVASRYTSLNAGSDFFSCPPGVDSQILFNADSGTGATLDVAWRDPYA